MRMGATQHSPEDDGPHPAQAAWAGNTMLKTLVPRLLCPTCRRPDAVLTAETFTEGLLGHIRDGALICQLCRAWYPIENDLLELVESSLWDPRDHASFCDRFEGQIRRHNLPAGRDLASPPESAERLSAQLKQRHHFDSWAGSKSNYRDYADAPFWSAVDELTFRQWKPRIKADGWLLDVGCANGRASFPLVAFNAAVIGFDISKKLVQQAIERARAEGWHAKTTFLVADADALPFRERSFEAVLTYGVLHHLPDPGRACENLQRILKDGGIHFASENNKTIFRRIFDLLMRVNPLWIEEAGAEPLISRRMVQDWTRGLPVWTVCSTMVFIPPHLCNLLGKRASRLLLQATDRLMSWVPGLADQGGLILMEIHKR